MFNKLEEAGVEAEAARVSRGEVYLAGVGHPLVSQREGGRSTKSIKRRRKVRK